MVATRANSRSIQEFLVTVGHDEPPIVLHANSKIISVKQACSCLQGVGAAAGAQFEFAELEVFVELVPFVVSGLAIFGFGADRAAPVEKPAIGADQVVLEYREVGLRGGQVVVSEDLGRDVDGEPSGDGLGGEHAPEVVRGDVQRLAGEVAQAGAGHGGGEQDLDEPGAHHFLPDADRALEQVR